MQNLATRVLELLSSAPVITAEPGLTVESRISYGVHGDDDELAFSVEWRDAEGCLWAADFSERALAQAKLTAVLCRARRMERNWCSGFAAWRINLYSHRRK